MTEQHVYVCIYICILYMPYRGMICAVRVGERKDLGSGCWNRKNA